MNAHQVQYMQSLSSLITIVVVTLSSGCDSILQNAYISVFMLKRFEPAFILWLLFLELLTKFIFILKTIFFVDVELEMFMRFNKIRGLVSDVETLTRALKNSQLLQVCLCQYHHIVCRVLN